MDTRIDEIEDRLDRISTFVPEIAAPAGFTCNQFLLDAGEPLLVHSGMRHLFPALSAAITTPRLRLLQPGRLTIWCLCRSVGCCRMR